MKIRLKAIMLLGLLALLIPLLLSYVGGVSGAASPNVVGQHQSAKTVNNSTCNGCHDKLATDESTDPNNSSAHRRHIVSAFLNFASNYTVSGTPATDTSYGCGRCHREAIYGGGVKEAMGNGFEGDLSYADTDTPNATDSAGRWNRAERKQVDPNWCARCHGSFRTTRTSDGAAIPDHLVGGIPVAQVDPRGCTSGCHDGVGPGPSPSTAHGATALGSSTADSGAGSWWVDQRYANAKDYCLRCHGELQWFQVPETNPTP